MKLKIVLLSLLFPAVMWAAIIPSDGTDSQIQAINDCTAGAPGCAANGDTITMPAGTFTWTGGLNLTKAVTISGQTTVTNAGLRPCRLNSPPCASANDQTIVIDQKPLHLPGSLIKAAIPVPAGTPVMFRITGITFQEYVQPTPTPPASPTPPKYGQDGAIKLNSSGTGASMSNPKNVRLDHCHFIHIRWGAIHQPGDWVYGVADHNLIEIDNTNTHSLLASNGSDGGKAKGRGSWGQPPFYGTEKFWFMEDNTVDGTGGAGGGVDASPGGKFICRHNYWNNANPNGHGTEGWDIRGMRALDIYDNIFHFTIPWTGGSQRGGSGMWHDNSFDIPPPNNSNVSSMTYFRMIGAAGGDIDTQWGNADGANAWDSNDPHGVYFSGTTDTAGTDTSHGIAATMTTVEALTPHAYEGMQIRNDNPSPSPCGPSPSPKCGPYHKASYITVNDDHHITYYYYALGDRGPQLKFLPGDAFSIRKVLIGLDQPGRGWGDDVDTSLPQPAGRFWPNERQETCFAWNNIILANGALLGYNSSIPSVHQGITADYYNYPTPQPADTIPAEVQTAYNATNNGVAFTSEFVYPHPLVSGASATPTNTPTSTPTGTPSSTPTVTSTATATATFTPTNTPTVTATTAPSPTPTATPVASGTPPPTPTAVPTMGPNLNAPLKINRPF